MDRSSRRIVTFIAVVTILVMAAMAIRSYLDADQSTTAAPVEATEDSAPEAPKREPTENVTDTSDEMPVAAPEIEDIPAITGEPSMTFENENGEARESTAPENDE
jgi:outer membrane biosynthesis protein TonB